jgi:LysM repeat protein
MKLQILSAIVAISATGAAATALNCGEVQTIYQDATCCDDSSVETCARKLSVPTSSPLSLDDDTGVLAIDLNDYASTIELTTGLGGKQDTISNADTIPQAITDALGGKQATISNADTIPQAITDALGGITDALGGKQATISNAGTIPQAITDALGGKQATLTTYSSIPGMTAALGGKQATISNEGTIPTPIASDLSAKQTLIDANTGKTSMVNYLPQNPDYKYQIIQPLRINSGMYVAGNLGNAFSALGASRYLRIDTLFPVPGSTSKYVVSYDSTAGNNNAVALKSQYSIMATNYYTHSDSRIKKDITDADTSALLDKLNQLRMRNYGYIAKEGSTVGWIAQEVAAVDAAYVSKQTEFVPDIDAVVAATVEDGKTTVNLSDFDIEVGQVLRVELRSGSKVVTVTGVADGMVTFDYAVVDDDVKYLQTEAGEVGTDGLIHIYGRQVDDFHTLDKNRIMATAVGAIQELSTRLEALEVRLAALE